jgi:hypothetical protein
MPDVNVRGAGMTDLTRFALVSLVTIGCWLRPSAPSFAVNDGSCGGKELAQTTVKTTLTVDARRRDVPHLTAETVVSLPSSWEGTSVLLSDHRGRGYAAKLQCLLPDWAEKLNRSTEFREREPTISVSDGRIHVHDKVEGDLFRWEDPPLLGFWRIDTTDRRLQFSLAVPYEEAPKDAPREAAGLRAASWDVTVKLEGLRFDAVQPPPKSRDGSTVSWERLAPRDATRLAIEVFVDRGVNLPLTFGSGPWGAVGTTLWAISSTILYVFVLALLRRGRLRKLPGDAAGHLKRGLRAARWLAIGGILFILVPLLSYLWTRDYDGVDLDTAYWRRSALVAIIGLALFYYVAQWPASKRLSAGLALGTCLLGGLVILQPSRFGLDQSFNSTIDAAGRLRRPELEPAAWLIAVNVTITFIAAGGMAVSLMRLAKHLRAGAPARTGSRRRVFSTRLLITMVSAIVAVGVVANWVWWVGQARIDNSLFERLDPELHRTVVRHVTGQLIAYPSNLLDQFPAFIWWLTIGAVLVVLRRLASESSGALWPSALSYRLLGLVFSGVLIGSWGWYLGVAFPLAFVLSFLLTAFVLPWGSKFNLLTRVGFRSGSHPDRASDSLLDLAGKSAEGVGRLRRRLLEADRHSDALTEKRQSLVGKLASGELTNKD